MQKQLALAVPAETLPDKTPYPPRVSLHLARRTLEPWTPGRWLWASQPFDSRPFVSSYAKALVRNIK